MATPFLTVTSLPTVTPVSMNAPSPMLQWLPTVAPCMMWAKAQTRVPSPTSSLSTTASGWYLAPAPALGSMSAPHPEPEENDRAQHRPPAGNRLHLGVPEGFRRVDLGHRYLTGAIAQADGLPV